MEDATGIELMTPISRWRVTRDVSDIRLKSYGCRQTSLKSDGQKLLISRINVEAPTVPPISKYKIPYKPF